MTKVNLFLLFYVFLTCAAPAAQADALTESGLGRAFLLDNSDRVRSLLDQNRARLDIIVQCLQNMTDDEFTAAKLPESRPKNFDAWASCQTGIGLIKQNTLLAYPQMRKVLLLSNLLQGDSLNLLLGDLLQNVSRGKFDNSAKTRVVTNVASWSTALVTKNPLIANETLTREELADPPWTLDELKSAVYGDSDTQEDKLSFNSIFKRGCENMKAQLKSSNRSEDSFLSMPAMDFCLQTPLEISKNGSIFLHYLGNANPYTEVNVARDFYKNALMEQQKSVEEQFMVLVKRDPWIALVNSATPSRAEFLHAFEIMSSRAVKNIAEDTKLRQEKHLDNDDLADDETLLNMLGYTPVAAYLVDNPGERYAYQQSLIPSADPQATFTELMTAYQHQERMKIVDNIAWILGKNLLLCWVPVRFAKVAVRLVKIERLQQIYKAATAADLIEGVFTPVCYGLYGLKLNIDMINDGIADYNKIYREVFGTVGEEHALREVNALSDQQRAIFWSLVMAPIGIGGPQVATILYRQAKKLPQKLLERAVQVAEMRKQQALQGAH